MKLNWGTGIAAFYSFFVLLFIGIVIKSKTYDLNMVKKDYYADDIGYQKHFDRVQNERRLSETVKITLLSLPDKTTQIQIGFPKNQKPIGDILLYRPAKDSDDRHYPIQTDAQNQMSIPLSKKTIGRWLVQINWSSDGMDYFKEEAIQVQP
jgi:hypothetical protein